jgi:hypothetical protein
MAIMMSPPIRSVARAAGVAQPDEKTEDLLSRLSKIDTSNDLDKNQAMRQLSAEIYVALDDDKSRISRAQIWIKLVLGLNVLFVIFSVFAAAAVMLSDSYFGKFISIASVKTISSFVVGPDGDIRSGFLVLLGTLGASTVMAKLLAETQKERRRRDFLKEVVEKHVELARETEARDSNKI